MIKIDKMISEEIDKHLVSNAITDNYAKTLQDDELTEGVTYLHKRDTGLSRDIIVDCGKTHEYYNHPLCLYIVSGNDVFPVNIIRDTTSLHGVPSDILMFIKDNYDALCSFANMEIDGPDFFYIIESYKKKLWYLG